MEERFWSKVNKTDTCWLWTASKFSDGYGQFWVDGKMKRAHKVSWLLAGNTIPDGLILCHAPHSVCGNRHCVNPAHLRTDTRTANSADRITDGTSNRGTKQGRSKLTDEIVLAIRANVEKKTQIELARQYGVTADNISLIIRRKSWAWLP